LSEPIIIVVEDSKLKMTKPGVTAPGFVI